MPPKKPSYGATDPSASPYNITLVEGRRTPSLGAILPASRPTVQVQPGLDKAVIPQPDPFGYPIHLTANASVNPNTMSGVNTAALTNPTNRGMYIDEIKWMLDAEVFASYYANVGAVLQCKLDLGKLPVTKGFVPVWCFDKSKTDSVGLFPGYGTGHQRTVLDLARSYAEYSFRPRYPIWIPPGGTLVPQFQHNGAINAPVNVRISYSGRVVPTGHVNTNKRIPYVAGWTSKTFTLDTTAQSDSSTETDLANENDQDIEVDRIVGRFPIFIISGTSYVLMDSTGTEGPQVLLRITHSDGYQVVRDNLPLWSVFNRISRALDVRHIMKANSFYTVDVEVDTTFDQANTTAQLQIGLVGSREI